MSSDSQYVGIVGAGIAGLAHAYAAARRGHHVTVFERTPVASGASIRNFGMVWPIGQPAGVPHQTALRSRQLWLDVASRSGIWLNPCGSIHLAHRDDEWAVLEQFAAAAPALGYDCKLLTPAEVLRRTDFANHDRLLGGLFSSSELCVNPRAAIRVLPGWLAQEFEVDFHFGTTITRLDLGRIESATYGVWEVDRVVICGGADFESLFPDVLVSSGLRRCKLQMLKAAPPRSGRLGPHLASGLTLRHYANFAVCPGLEALRRRVAADTPELDEFGIHVMAAQNDAGEIILGDSHEYDSRIEFFDKSLIDDLILRELRRVIRLPDWTIAEHWHGIYAKHPTQPVFEAEPMEGVHIFTGLGGAGMTMAFGLADLCWERWS